MPHPPFQKQCLVDAAMRASAGLLAVAAAMAFGGCEDRLRPRGDPSARSPSHATPGSPWFEDVAFERGVQFAFQSGHAGEEYYLPEIIGGGGAFLDFDNDGYLDIYLVQGGRLAAPLENPPNVLLRNRGDGTFAEVPNAGGADDRGYGMGVACGDFNNDGYVDLYVTNLGPNVLYRNNGDGTFKDVTASAGVGHPGWSTSAAFLDYNANGWLDLFVCNYLNWSIENELTCYNSLGGRDYCNPANYYAPAMDALYRNNGDGTFTDVTFHAGLDSFYGTGLGVVCADFNGDGWTDIFVANDGMRNQLWFNRRDGTFIDLALEMGCAVDEEGKTKAGMGVDAADFNDDGELDLLIVNLRLESNTLLKNQVIQFIDVTAQAGLRASTRQYTGFGVGWIDFDNDGLLDVYEANGLVTRDGALLGADDPFAQPNLLFQGAAGGRYAEVMPKGGTASPLVHTSRAAAFGDFDNDGGIDVLVVNRDAPAYVLRNVIHTRTNNHWIKLRLIEHNREAANAVAVVRAGDRTVVRRGSAAFSYLASNDPRVHVGLGQAQRADEVRVHWVGGAVEVFGPLEANRIHTLVRGSGQTAR